MGMSAGQARLLSITSRLTNNEFRAQTITNSKLRLANKSQEASQRYMDALGTQKLMYGIYNDNGEYTQQALTPAIIYDYQPLKTQYAITNSAGKMLVSAKDVENFENTKDLFEFLEKYGLTDFTTASDKYKEDLTKYENDTNQYNIDKANYDEEMEKYNAQIEEYNKALTEHNKKVQEYNEQLEKYEKIKDLPNLYDNFKAIVGTSDSPQSCYSTALNGGSDCYKHVLAHLLGMGIPNNDGSNKGDTNFNTSINGLNITTSYTKDIAYSGIKYGGKTGDFTIIAETIKNPAYRDLYLCDEDDDWNTAGKQNLIQERINAGGSFDLTNQDDIKILLKSDFVYDATTNTCLGPKTLYQKTIDLYYLIDNGMLNSSEMNESLKNYTDGDMKNLTPDPGDPPIFTQEAPPYPDLKVPTAPVKPTKPSFEIKLTDKEKSQWYVNLWYKMNGSDTANLVTKFDVSYSSEYEDDVKKIVSDEIVFYVDNNTTSKNSNSKGNYEIFENNLYTSSDWLQFALEHGMVTLQRADYFIPSENSGKVPTLKGEGITWNAIPYTNASNIIAVDDEVKIALAEVKYKNELNEIEAKDKKYDQDLKKLETEHTALQTEYDSVKEVISKNVERSFKAFS